jgi:outer membrane protein assembly factor BamB
MRDRKEVRLAHRDSNPLPQRFMETHRMPLLRPAFRVVFAASAFGAVLFPIGANTPAQADWPQWRGAHRDDISTETGLLQSWPEGGPTRVWLSDKCGQGYSGPAIVNGTIYIMGTRDDQEVLFALDEASSNEKWFAPVGEIYKESHGDGPRCTPTVDGGHIYVLGAKGNLVCVETATGKVVWMKAMEEFGGRLPKWAYCESPYIYKEMVLCTPGGKQGSIVALNKLTGEKVWQMADVTSDAHYTSIVPMPLDGKDDAVQLLPDQLIGFNPADGKLLWSVPFGKPVATIPTPVVHDRDVYATSAYGVGCLMVHVGADHAAEKVYENKVMKNKQGGVVLLDGRIFGHSDGVGWVAQDFKTGEQIWRDRDVMKMGAVSYADGRFYCLDQDSGEIALVEPSAEKWIEHGRFKLDPQSDQRGQGGKVWTIPVICNGKLYLRDQQYLYCYDIHREGVAQGGSATAK